MANLKLPAVLGGALGVAGAVGAVAIARERKQVGRDRSRIDTKAAARFGALPFDRESTVTATDGIKLHVEEVGPLTAPLTVVFVHGFTLNLGAFHFQRLALSAAFGDQVRLVFFDQRSHGRSQRSPAADCTLEQTARDLGSVIEATAPDGPIVLVGHSMGGMTVMTLAALEPELFAHAGGRRGRIGSVALINTSSGNLKTVTLGLPNFLARFRGPVLPVVLRRAARNANLVEKGRALGKDLAWVITKRLSFGSDDVPPAVVAYATAMIAATPVTVVSDFYPTLMAHDGHLGLMNLIGCRVLVFGAEHDVLTPLSHAEMIAAALPDAEFIEVPDAGHLLMLEKPEIVDGPLEELVGQALPTATSGANGSKRRLRTRAQG